MSISNHLSSILKRKCHCENLGIWHHMLRKRRAVSPTHTIGVRHTGLWPQQWALQWFMNQSQPLSGLVQETLQHTGLVNHPQTRKHLRKSRFQQRSPNTPIEQQKEKKKKKKRNLDILETFYALSLPKGITAWSQERFSQSMTSP